MNTSYTILQVFIHSEALKELLDTVFPDEILTWSDEILTHILHLVRYHNINISVRVPSVGPVWSLT